ncbi:MAG: NADH:ubiquinone oxidoreductase subunit NDUFA12 [Sphingomonadales bacterium]|nr:NADH:ubiquinone oxidoreductase subunit NDUFA12 [Sphingomonadales bacterium]
MGIFKNIFTWWGRRDLRDLAWHRNQGQTRRAMMPKAMSITKAARLLGGLPRRWVMYNGLNGASRVPPEWHGWLHHMIDDVPENALPPAHIWEKAPSRNLTGTVHAYRPAGAPEAVAKRAAATGDYQAWSPEQGWASGALDPGGLAARLASWQGICADR